MKKTTEHGQDLVVGLGATGLSIARYLKRIGGSAVFTDNRDEPPGADTLEEIWPDAEVAFGEFELPEGIERLVVSPGV
ncbi:MAG: UDP-N-acetylmuramoyl-L-alanine--D-glutamate ligase, partial [Pseudomonadota bacterium]